MTKERFIELVAKLNEEEFENFKSGINQITFEYGWGNGFDDNALILELYREE